MVCVLLNRATRLITPDLVAGTRVRVPLLDGRSVNYVNLDNAASTPPFCAVVHKVDQFMNWYSNVHRGTGFKSQVATLAYEEARREVGLFVGADPELDTVIMVRNTTEAINKLARRLSFSPDSVIITTGMEHHSNDLPWRGKARVIYTGITPHGKLDLANLQELLRKNAGRTALLAVTGASNVTGYINDVHLLARLAHENGAWIFVDAAQLAPHREIDMGSHGDPEHLDFVAFSGHKLYAPYGAGALIGPKEVFEKGEPDQPGGGTIDLVSETSVIWAEPPHKEEAGTPNLPGAIALGAALKILRQIGMHRIAAHEQGLTAYALEHLRQLPGLKVYGSDNPALADERVGVISFSVSSLKSAMVAAILSCEGGIGVRSGCFCAQPYVTSLLGIAPDHLRKIWNDVARGNHRDKPGLVRISFGLYNTREDVDRLMVELKRVIEHRYQGDYLFDDSRGGYWPKGYSPRFTDYFAI